MFGSNGRTRSVTRRVYPRECERRDGRARELARSPRLLFYVREHYLLLLTLCVVHARRPLQPMIAADDVVVGCCVVDGGGGVVLPSVPFRRLPSLSQLSATAAAVLPRAETLSILLATNSRG